MALCHKTKASEKTIEIDATIKSTSNEKINQVYTFDAPELSHDFQSLRIPKEESGVVCRNERDI